MPDQFTRHSVRNGVLTLAVDGEFEVSGLLTEQENKITKQHNNSRRLGLEGREENKCARTKACPNQSRGVSGCAHSYADPPIDRSANVDTISQHTTWTCDVPT